MVDYGTSTWLRRPADTAAPGSPPPDLWACSLPAPLWRGWPRAQRAGGRYGGRSGGRPRRGLAARPRTLAAAVLRRLSSGPPWQLATASNWGLECCARMPRSRRQLLNGGLECCARMPRFRRQLLNGLECCARMAQQPPGARGCDLAHCDFLERDKAIKPQRAQWVENKEIISTSNSPQYYKGKLGNCLCFMDSFLSKALPFIRESGGGEGVDEATDSNRTEIFKLCLCF